MVLFFIVGSCIAAFATQLVVNRLREYEHLPEPTEPLSCLQDCFRKLKRIFDHQMVILEEETANSSCVSFSGRDPADVPKSSLLFHKVAFVDYFEISLQATVVSMLEVTWQCWLSLIFLAVVNSVRIFSLPGELQSKSVSQYTSDDRITNHITYILVIGWTIAIVFVVAALYLVKRFFAYLAFTASERTKEEELVVPQEETKRNARTQIGTRQVWLPPKQLTAHLVGDMHTDPSMFLLRGDKGFTFHVFKVPFLCVDLYFSIFVVGIWGEMSLTAGAVQAALIPLALVPLVLVFAFFPLVLPIVAALTSLGSRLDDQLAKKTCSKNHKT